MRSPAHRKLIIDPSYLRIGFGFCREDDDSDSTIVVQILEENRMKKINFQNGEPKF